MWLRALAQNQETKRVYVPFIYFHLKNLKEITGVKGNDQANRLAGKATLTSGLLLGRVEVLSSLSHDLQVQS